MSEFEDQFLIYMDPGTLNAAAADAYVRGVRAVLVRLRARQVGDVLLRSIRFHGKYVRISPYQSSAFAVGPDCNATTVAGEAQDLVFNRNIAPLLQSISRKPVRPIRAVVRYSPDMWRAGGSCHKGGVAHAIASVLKGSFNPTPEAVLAHELTHAVRSVSGKLDSDPTKGGHGGLYLYDSAEEFMACVVENIFQSEIGGNIRSSHHGFFTLDKDLDDSFAFFQVGMKAFEYIDKFCRENIGLTQALACVRTRFNPLAAYYKDRAKARSISQSQYAARREVSGWITEFLSP